MALETLCVPWRRSRWGRLRGAAQGAISRYICWALWGRSEPESAWSCMRGPADRAKASQTRKHGEGTEYCPCTRLTRGCMLDNARPS